MNLQNVLAPTRSKLSTAGRRSGAKLSAIPRWTRTKLVAIGRGAAKTTAGTRRQYRRVLKTTAPIRKHGYIWLITIGLLVAAQATLIWTPTVGIYMNAGALVGLCIVAIRQQAARQLAISMAIIPVANMVTASFALQTNMARTVVMYATILLLALVYRFMFTLAFPEFSTRLMKKGYLFGLPLMIVIGQIFGLIGYAFLRNHYPYTDYSLPLIVLAAVVFAFAEEMLLRGLIQQQGEKVFHPIVAAVTAAILYVFLALDHATMLTLPVAIMMGSGLALVYYLKKNLLLTVTLNATAKLVYIGLVASFILR